MKKFLGVFVIILLLACEAKENPLVDPDYTRGLVGDWQVVLYEVEGEGIGKLIADIDSDELKEFTFNLEAEKLDENEFFIEFTEDTVTNRILIPSGKISVKTGVRYDELTPTFRSQEPFPFENATWVEANGKLIVSLVEANDTVEYTFNQKIDESNRNVELTTNELPAQIRERLERNMIIENLTGAMKIELQRKAP